MIEALQLAGGKPKYTEYPGVNHDAWTPALAEPDLLPWMFAQNIQKPAVASGPFKPTDESLKGKAHEIDDPITEYLKSQVQAP